MPKESLGEAQKTMQTTCGRATRRGALQGPTAKRGLSHLLPADDEEFDMLYFASARDYIVHTNFRL
jgi:hypothetical protein